MRVHVLMYIYRGWCAGLCSVFRGVRGCFVFMGVLDIVSIMGQTRDNGSGKQFGSHVDYVVEGVVPFGSLDVVGAGDVQERSLSVPYRPSRLVRAVRSAPKGGWGAPMDDPMWMDTMMLYAPHIVPGRCHSNWGKSRNYPVYDTVMEYLQEVPLDILRLTAWYVRWCEAGEGRYKDLPQQMRIELHAARGEYPVCGAIMNYAEEMRLNQMSGNALERLVEFSEDDRPFLRQSAVAAASKLVDFKERRDAAKSVQESSVGGGGLTLSVNIAAMLGAAMPVAEIKSVEVVDEKGRSG